MERRRLGPPNRLVTEAALLAALGGIVAVGSVTAATRQVPPRVPLDWIAWVLMTAAVALLPLRRRYPLAVLLGSVAVGGAYLALGYPYGPVFFVVSIASYTLAATAPPRRAVAGLFGAVAVLVVAQVFPLRLAGFLGQFVVLVFAWSAWVGIPAWLAATVRLRRAHLADVAERRRQQERAERERAERVAAEQRLAVSRDVHDVVAHSLSLISLQSGTALHIFDQQPEQAKAAVVTIRQSSSEALRDLRRVLANLRQPDEPHHDEARLDQLTELVDRIRHDDLAVSLRIDGASRELPEQVQTCAYRVVQESLTNVIRHADAASAMVRLSYQDDGLVVEVTDDGAGVARDSTLGHGIAGMRDRAAAVGGWVSARAAPAGGFAVRAWLPGTEDA
ncbi:MAG: sensor histidine kinase [Sciscionella sp.]